MNDLELEMLTAELVRRGHSREEIIFAICREHDLQWRDVEPVVDHVFSTQAPRLKTSFIGLRPLLLLAGLVLGGGLILTAGLEAIGLAKIIAPEAGLVEVIQTAAGLIVGSMRLWSQLIVGGVLFALSLGKLLGYISRAVG